MTSLISVDGVIEEDKNLAPLSWLKIGGSAEYFYSPESIGDLQAFFKQVPKEMSITVIGNLSNTLVRDGGVKGFVIRLDGLKDIIVNDLEIEIEAGALNRLLCVKARDEGLGGLEFLNAIPGTIGGAIKMNAGAHGKEVKDALISCKVMDRQGKIQELSNSDIQFSYRKSSIADDLIIISAVFQAERKTVEDIENMMHAFNEHRNKAQPIRDKTGGSTFRNPEGKDAWKLIDDAGLRGHKVGGAKISEKHTNFIINFFDATSQDVEDLLKEVKEKVLENSGIELETELKIIGEK